RGQPPTAAGRTPPAAAPFSHPFAARLPSAAGLLFAALTCPCLSQRFYLSPAGRSAGRKKLLLTPRKAVYILPLTSIGVTIEYGYCLNSYPERRRDWPNEARQPAAH